MREHRSTQGTGERAAVERTPAQARAHTVLHSSVRDVLSSAGSPLDASIRNFMEPRFGRELGGGRTHLNGSVPAHPKIGPPGDSVERSADAMADRVMSVNESRSGPRFDFSGVRVHADAQAARSARAM